jgi:hypothetical protein
MLQTHIRVHERCEIYEISANMAQHYTHRTMDVPDDFGMQYLTPSASPVHARPGLSRTWARPLPLTGRTRFEQVNHSDGLDGGISEINEEVSLSYHPPHLRECRSHPTLAPHRGAPASSASTITTLPSIEPSSLHKVDSVATRPSMPKQLRSPRSTLAKAVQPSKLVVHPLNFETPPETLETRFIDSAGIVIPGVCDRIQCRHPRVHFVSAFQSSDPTEYTTLLADHGVTYSDYARLIDAAQNIVADLSIEPKPGLVESHPKRNPKYQRIVSRFDRKQSRDMDAAHLMCPNQRIQHNATLLIDLLDNISRSFRSRGIPIVVCVSSFSLLTSEQSMDAHIQILHAPTSTQDTKGRTKWHARATECLSFIEPKDFGRLNGMWASDSRHQSIEYADLSSVGTMVEIQSSCDRLGTSTQRQISPWPVWPNAIPSSKRCAMAEGAEHYGANPYFRAWMRASLDSRTTCGTYNEHMLDKEENSVLNERLGNLESPASSAPAGTTTRARYQHNRQLEFRWSIENGSRSRLIQFSSCIKVRPPHNPELDEFGLSKDDFEAVIARVDEIVSARMETPQPLRTSVSSVLCKFCDCRNNDVILKLRRFIRKLNAAQRRIVWTLETIVDTCGDHIDWEISAWNGEDSLELLIELERWGIVERRLDVEEY